MKSNGHGGKREGAGRKFAPEEEKKYPLQVYLTKDELETIERLAEEKQVKKSVLAREILTNAIKRC